MTEETQLTVRTIFLIIAAALLAFWHAVIFLVYWGLT
jgi:hypothetical protein